MFRFVLATCVISQVTLIANVNGQDYTSPPLPCNGTSVLLSGGEWCLNIFGDLMSWSDAEQNCVNNSGHLAEVFSADLQQSISDTLATYGQTEAGDAFWLGSRKDEDTVRSLVWTWTRENSIISPQGCFIEWTVSPDLEYSVTTLSQQPMTVERCVDACRNLNYSYAGIQNGVQCACSETFGKHGPSSDCTIPCMGNYNEFCGGWSRNSIFAVDGTPLTWVFNEPSNSIEDHNCALFDYKKLNFQAASCHSPFPFLCVADDNSMCADATLSTSYQQMGSRCFMIPTPDATLDWFSARQVCTNSGGDLANDDLSVSDLISLASMINSTMYGLPQPLVWVGLAQQEWFWLNGSAISYSNYALGEPLVGTNSSSCLYMDSADNVEQFSWKTGACAMLKKSLCMIPNSANGFQSFGFAAISILGMQFFWKILQHW